MSLPMQDGHTFGYTHDDDNIADPEISENDLSALTFYVAGLAPPRPSDDEPIGANLFHEVGCADCHVPKLSPTMPVAAYTDLLLHDVSKSTSWGIAEGSARPEEYRTPPLWGLRDTAPYLHDGSAPTPHAAILRHGGEARATVERYQALSETGQEYLLNFLMTR